MVEGPLPQSAGSPPDLLALRRARLPELLAAFDALLALGADEHRRHAMAVVAELAVDESVRLIRCGTRLEVVDANSALGRWCSGPAGRAIEEADPGTHALVAGLLFVLAAAGAPDAAGGDEVVLRSWNGKAREAVRLVAAAPEAMLSRARLRSALDVSESYLSHLLADLEAASLLERIRVPGRRGVEVHLGGRGFALLREGSEGLGGAGAGDGAPTEVATDTAIGDPPAVAPDAATCEPPPVRARRRRSVARVRAEGLDRRLSRRDREGRALHLG